MNELKNIPTDVLDDIVNSLDTIDYGYFLYTESVQLDTNLSETWITVGSQSDAGDDGKLGSTARIEIEYGNDNEQFIEHDVDLTVGQSSVRGTEQRAFEQLVKQLRTEVADRIDGKR